MKNIKITKNSEILLSQNECGYEKVLNDFSNAKRISIVTYNISNRDIQLIEKLRQLKNVKIDLITNIPNRWDNYFKPYYRERASDSIKNYFRILSPDKFESEISVYFNFSNHSKIIATDNYAYIGSANYSSESSKNFEAGILISDSNLVNQVHEKFVAEIIEQSNEYFGKDILDDLIVLVDKFLAEIELFDELYLSNVFNRYLSAKQGEKHLDIKLNKLNFKDFDNFSFYTSWFIEELESISSVLEKHLDSETYTLLKNIEKLIFENKDLEKFTKFNEEGFFQSSFEDLLIHDDGENTEELLQVSLNETEHKKEEVIEIATSHLIKLDDFTQELLELVDELTNKLSDLRNEEKNIDNTK
ncbi:hypothetical protein F7646_13020 [Tenacibaculum finnmarkense genomovar finnmarkense]|uniref:phospholipase D-like domain-containing protein n=1 Tax=Tenacibaculum finnmarkense TaxID=2781243 RepID=UPI00187B5ADF|nr:phospholipase D-like domain-containing protein [Tenacibaculum finnmarkense]MBE7661494.1 hypothetical protein [Tenacibaculum finnmarkense genomovar finnmarkense]